MPLRALLFAGLIFLIGAANAGDNEEAISLAETAAASWLELADQGKYEDTWMQASPLFQAAISVEDWTQALGAARAPLEALVSRESKSAEFFLELPGAPDGEYVVLTFDSVFARKVRAVETVTVMKNDDGTWRVSGYFIR